MNTQRKSTYAIKKEGGEIMSNIRLVNDQYTADDLACMSIMDIEQRIDDLRKFAPDLSVMRIREITDCGKRLLAVAEEAINA